MLRDIKWLFYDIFSYIGSDFYSGPKIYIKKHPELFSQELSKYMRDIFGTDSLVLKEFLSDEKIDALPVKNESLFANMSLSGESIPVPQLIKNKYLKEEMNKALSAAHENVKKRLAELRKKSTKST